MKTVHTATEFEARSRKVCLAIGSSTACISAHQQIIRQTIADSRQHDALALVLTFDQHPNTDRPRHTACRP